MSHRMPECLQHRMGPDDDRMLCQIKCEIDCHMSEYMLQKRPENMPEKVQMSDRMSVGGDYGISQCQAAKLGTQYIYTKCA